MLGKIVSPRLEKLEKDFLVSGGKWKEFKIGELFDIGTGSSLSSEELRTGEIKRVSAKSFDNGIIGTFSTEDLPNARHFENFISVNFFGDVFYHSYKASVEMKVHTLKLKKKEFNSKTGLYIAGAVKKILRNQFGYGNQLSSSKLKECDFRILLPVLNGKINFSYMEKFIEELEVERIEELEAYLIATGLKDYTLNQKDIETLDSFSKMADNPLDRQTDRIRLEDILDWQIGIKEIDPLKLGKLHEDGEKYPFYGQAIEDNGVISYVSLIDEVLNNEKALPTIMIHSNNQNIIYLETPFYLKDGHGATSVLQNKNMNKNSALYFMGAIQKVIKNRFDYNAKATKIGLKNTVIELPVRNHEVDYTFMEDFIIAIKKLVIKDVVLWADKKIATTKRVVNKVNK